MEESDRLITLSEHRQSHRMHTSLRFQEIDEGVHIVTLNGVTRSFLYNIAFVRFREVNLDDTQEGIQSLVTSVNIFFHSLPERSSSTNVLVKFQSISIA